MTRYQPGNCPACGRPVAANAGHPPPKCHDCATEEMIGIDPSVPSGHHTTPQAAQWVADRMKELEAQRDEAIEQRDALSATLERLHNALGPKVLDWIDCGMAANNRHKEAWARELRNELHQALAETPANSLARLKAQWQAEALAREARGFDQGARDADSFIERITYRRASRRLLETADKLRIQAEGGE